MPSRSLLSAAALAAGAAVFLIAFPAFAQVPAVADSGNTAWIIVASALVLFMTLPGLALFYGGLVGSRNILSVMLHCFTICCVVSILWLLGGYSLAFGDGGPWLGTIDKIFLNNLSDTLVAGGLPENAFALFQMTFAIITPALVVGAFPERVNLGFLMVFSALWLVIVYLPVAHWMWGGGWLAGMGALDFAGGIVVHTTAGTAALVAAVMIGARRGFPMDLTPPHSPTLTMIGAGMLWVGWFGFNGGSALAASGGAAQTILATHMAASAGALTWMILEWVKVGKPTSIGVATGCIAGLATVTPASGYIGPGGGLLIGILGGLVCFTVTLFVKRRLRVDDSLDVFAVHGVGGAMGSLLLSVLALPVLGGVGLADGMTWVSQLGVQALAVGVVALWTAVATAVAVLVAGVICGRRVHRDQEMEGLDLALHGERGYDFT